MLLSILKLVTLTETARPLAVITEDKAVIFHNFSQPSLLRGRGRVALN